MHRREFLKFGALGLVTPWGFFQRKNTNKETTNNIKPTVLDLLSDQKTLLDTLSRKIITKRLQWSPFEKTYCQHTHQ